MKYANNWTRKYYICRIQLECNLSESCQCHHFAYHFAYNCRKLYKLSVRHCQSVCRGFQPSKTSKFTHRCAERTLNSSLIHTHTHHTPRTPHPAHPAHSRTMCNSLKHAALNFCLLGSIPLASLNLCRQAKLSTTLALHSPLFTLHTLKHYTSLSVYTTVGPFAIFRYKFGIKFRFLILCAMRLQQ